MFTYLKLKNFKSFKDITLNFRNSSGKSNNLVVIYGENGSGKSNLVEAFGFLKDTMYTIENKNQFEEIKNDTYRDNLDDIKLILDKLMISEMSNMDLSKLIKNIRCIGTQDDIEIEYGFNINNIDGYYRMVLNTEIKEEELYYNISKRRGIHFKIKEDKIELSSGIFQDNNYREDLIEKIKKYWGKNTFLSIFYYEMRNVNKEYLEERINQNIFRVIYFFTLYNIRFNKEKGINARFSTKYGALMDLDGNQVKQLNEIELKKKENLLRYIFTNLYSDIKDIYYKVDYNIKGEISDHSLYVKKMIGGELRDINFKYESTGTKKILDLILPLIEATTGNTSIIDEADTGIHDILFNKLILSVNDYIKGQLIITTHNITLLEEIPKENIYFIVIDHNGEKELFNIRDYKTATKTNHNIRDRYIKGVYGGIPLTGYFDFEDLIDILDDDNYE